MKQLYSLYDQFLEWLIRTSWGRICSGALSIALANKLYADFTRLERGEIDQLWGRKWIMQTYDIGGKWPLVIFFSVFGLASIAWGFRLFITGNDDLGDEPSKLEPPNQPDDSKDF